MINNYENYIILIGQRQNKETELKAIVLSCARTARVSCSYLRSFTELQLKFQVSFSDAWSSVFLSLQILDEVEKRRAISPALVQPFMRGIMEAPFPAPGRTITVKNFLPGSGTEVRGLGGTEGVML